MIYTTSNVLIIASLCFHFLVFVGHGLGSRYLGAALREQADKFQLPVLLGTQELKNTVFYSRL